MQKIKNKLRSRGSVLVFTLIILTIMITAALSIASVTVIERKTSGATGASNQAFRVADSSVEIVMKKISDNSTDTLNSIGTHCNSGVVSMNSVVGGTSRLEFYSDETTKITDCNATLSSIAKIKSIGTFKNTNRAVEVAVAATGDPVGTCQNASDMLFIRFEQTCPSGFPQCQRTDIESAGKKGCLPSGSQYQWNIKGCIGGGSREKATLSFTNNGWNLDPDGYCDEGGIPQFTGNNACCKKGL